MWLFFRLKKAKAASHKLNENNQNNIEPSCPPQVAATLKNVGNWELECAATYSRVKSSTAKEYDKKPMESVVLIVKMYDSGHAELIRVVFFFNKPSCGTITSKSAAVVARSNK